MDSTPETLAKINQGSKAEALYPFMEGILEEVRKVAVDRLKAMVRDGSATESRMLACGAELCTIDDIENRFKAKINKGRGASKELHGSEQ